MSFSSQLAGWVEMNPWWGFVGCIIALFTTVLAIILYFKSKKVKLPRYAIRSTNIVRDLSSKFGSLEMRYSGKSIENFTATKILFWNAGSDTIDNRDIASSDPITVHVKEDYKILDSKILHEKNKANNFSITTYSDQSYILLEFDYIDKDEGAVIQLIHTGRSGKDIEVQGTVKGAGAPIRKSVPRSERSSFKPLTRPPSWVDKIVVAIFLFFVFVFPVLMASILLPPPETVITPAVVYVVVIFIVIVYWGLGFSIIRRRIPKGFDVFEEEF